MFRCTVLAAVSFITLGCGKSQNREATEAPTEPALTRPVAAEKRPPFVGMGEWSRIGDVQIRVEGVFVAESILNTYDPAEFNAEVTRQPDRRQLIADLSIQNVSTTRKLDYARWALPKSAFVLDDRRLWYDLLPTKSTYKHINGGLKLGVKPLDPPFKDYVLFEAPGEDVNELWLVLASQATTEKGRGKHVFVITRDQIKRQERWTPDSDR